METACLRARVEGELALERLDGLAHDREAEAEALAVGRRAPEETLEDEVALRRGDSRAAVLTAIVTRPSPLCSQRTVARCVLERILAEVRERLLEQRTVRDHRDVGFALDLDPLGGEHSASERGTGSTSMSSCRGDSSRV